jgi:PAS domain S-box-containing protein
MHRLGHLLSRLRRSVSYRQPTLGGTTAMASNEVRRIVDAIPGLAWSCAPNGDFDYFNQRWCDYSGMSLADACNGGWRDAIHPDDFDRVYQWGLERRRTGQAGEVEARLRRSDGEFHWFLISTEPEPNYAGAAVPRWYGQQTDIDGRKRAEALLAGQKQLLEMVAGGCSVNVVLEALCELLEKTINRCRCSVFLLDSSGTSCQLGAGPNLPASFTDALQGRPVGTGEAGPFALAAYTKEQVIATDLTSESRWQDDWSPLALAHGFRACWSTPISSRGLYHVPDGKVLGTLTVYFPEPITPTPFHLNVISQFADLAGIAIERAECEVTVRRSEAFLAEAQHLSSTGSFSWKCATGEITWSDEVYRIYGLDKVVPVTLEMFTARVHPEDLPFVGETMDRARRDMQDFEFEHRLALPDGTVKYLHVVAHMTRDKDGLVEYIGAVQDVTERRRSEEALSKVRSELAHVARVMTLGALTASIAHEVNQPLSGIVTNANTCLRMLAADPPDLDGARETALRTIRDGNRAADVITRLRGLFAKKDLATDSVNLNEATEEVIALSRTELHQARVLLRTHFAEDLPLVTGDRVQLQQVILNLLLNACDAMAGVEDRPRLLVIRSERDDDDQVRLTVQDSGVGVDPEDLEKIFDAFYTTKPDGMGIGLSVSRSIIESHHGRLWAAPNAGPMRGASFSLSLPACPDSMPGNDRCSGRRTRRQRFS